MKTILCFTPLLFSVTMGSGFAQQDISTWRAIILDKPFHAGDSKLRDMAQRNPQAKQFTGNFELPAVIKPGVGTIVYVNLDVAGVLPMGEPELAQVRKQPHLGTRLLINGKEAVILNALAKKRGANSIYQKISVRISGTLLQPGQNEVQVVPGRRGQIDDIELRSVTVSSRAE